MIEEKEFDLFFDDLIHLDDLEIIESKLLINCENMKSIVSTLVGLNRKESDDEVIYSKDSIESYNSSNQYLILPPLSFIRSPIENTFGISFYNAMNAGDIEYIRNLINTHFTYNCLFLATNSGQKVNYIGQHQLSSFFNFIISAYPDGIVRLRSSKLLELKGIIVMLQKSVLDGTYVPANSMASLNNGGKATKQLLNATNLSTNSINKLRVKQYSTIYIDKQTHKIVSFEIRRKVKFYQILSSQDI